MANALHRRLVMSKIPVNVTIDEDLNEWLEGMATELRMNKSQFMNNAISAGKDDVKVLKAIGLFYVGKLLMGSKHKGAKVTLKKKISVNMTIDEDLDEWLEGMATELRMNKSQFMNNVISAAKGDVRVLKAIGAFGLGKMVMKVKEKGLKVKMPNSAPVGQKAK
jgi:predicted transcriptional regulator